MTQKMEKIELQPALDQLVTDDMITQMLTHIRPATEDVFIPLLDPDETANIVISYMGDSDSINTLVLHVAVVDTPNGIGIKVTNDTENSNTVLVQ